jgi:very-short-patch-repair endonuclease
MKYLKVFNESNKSKNKKEYNNIDKIRSYVKDMYNDEFEILDGECLNSLSLLRIKHNKCGHIWFKKIGPFLNSGSKCPDCAKGRNNLLTLQSRCDLKYNGEYSIINIDGYVNNKSNITVRHNKCGHIFTPRMDNFFNSSTKCPKCAGKCKLTIDEVKRRFHNLYSDDYSLIIEDEPKNNDTLLTINHNCGNTWTAILSNILYKNTGCPFCKISRGERLIKTYLDDNKINYKMEYRFKDLKNKRLLPFDFYLKDFNMCIEFDGIQHFEPIEFFGGQSSLDRNIIIDKMKTDFCISKGIELIRISYKDIGKIKVILDEVFKKV